MEISETLVSKSNGNLKEQHMAGPLTDVIPDSVMQFKVYVNSMYYINCNYSKRLLRFAERWKLWSN